MNSTTLTLGVPTLADDLRLKPQARKILAHLRAGKSITPMEALTVYSIFRLAASIFEIRKLGYNVETDVREDEQGHKYARYTLPARRLAA
jgi:hypothetical protein